MKKILLVDDSKTQLNALKLMLKKSGFEVEIAQSGAEAFNKAYKFVPDLIISDVLMPDLNGYQLCRLLKNSVELKKIPVILLTAFDEKINSFWSLKAGAQKYIVKNADYSILENSCFELINKYPISQTEKTDISSAETQEKSPQVLLNEIIDDALIRQTIMNEFRELIKYVNDEKSLVTNLIKLISTIIDFEVFYLSFENKSDDNKKNLYINTKSGFLSENSIENIKNSQHFSDYIIEQFNFGVSNEEKEIKNCNFNCIEINDESELLGRLGFIFNFSSLRTNVLYLNLVKQELTLLFKVKRLYDINKLLSIKDVLTGLDNRRSFEEHYEREFSRASRYQLPLSMAILDIDYFKNINDEYGHSAGDYVLSEFAKLIQSVYRKTDLIFRYGGEEFLILLPQTDKEHAFIPLERLRNKIENKIFSFNGSDIKLTISVGISDNSKEKDKSLILKNTDIALYKAKNSGRNRVILSDE